MKIFFSFMLLFNIILSDTDTIQSIEITTLDGNIFVGTLIEEDENLYRIVTNSGINIDINPTSIDLFNIIRPKDINLCATIDDKKKEYKVYFDHPFSPINTLDKEYYNSFKDKFFKEGSSITIKSKSIDEILNPSKTQLP